MRGCVIRRAGAILALALSRKIGAESAKSGNRSLEFSIIPVAPVKGSSLHNHLIYNELHPKTGP